MTTLDELKQLIKDSFGIDPNSVKEDSSLADYGLDSLSLVELLFVIEEHFDLDIPSSRSEIKTLSGLASMIDELKSAQPA